MRHLEASAVDVVLVVPPFADVERPALGPSLLAAALGQRGLRAAVVYPNLAWAERIGLALYAWFANRGDADAETTALGLSTLVSEWVFAELASDRIDATPSYGEQFLAPALDPAALARVLATLELREAFVCETVDRIQRLRPRIVGFTTTLASTTAGLALARRLAAGPDRPLIVFGGSACEEAMGAALLEAFDFVDWVCSGEGEVAFVDFAAAIVAGERPHVAGMRSRGGLARTPAPVAMDSLPIPDFRDYFAALARSPLREQLRPRLPFESSRGCWWGQKHHCSFCGLNGATMQFRAKTPERALTELRTLVDAWQIADVEAVDNIVDHRYFASVFPRLAAEGPEVRLFYETKSNLDRDDVALLRRAGVRAIQPGIESLDTGTLRLMRKGTTAAQNLCLLRWCAEYGVGVAWNILYGFPREDPAAAARMAELVPLLHHLPPPSGAGRIRLDRFSPLFTSREDLINVRPMLAYRWIFGLPDSALEQLAYFFEFDYADGRDPDAYAAPLVQAVARWIDPQRPRERLDAVRAGEVVMVTDTRALAQRPAHVLSGALARLLLACDRPRQLAGLTTELALGDAELLAQLAELQRRRLLVALDDRFVALPIWRGESQLS